MRRSGGNHYEAKMRKIRPDKRRIISKRLLETAAEMRQQKSGRVHHG